MRTVQETWDLLDGLAPPLPAVQVPLAEAMGRVLRQDVSAAEDQPPFSRSAMDGYLLCAGETMMELRVTGEVRPGEPACSPEPGTALRIFTGSAVPDAGAVVIMQEDVERTGSTIRLQRIPGPEHIRARGSQARAGSVLAHAGCSITPGGIALLASVGVAHPLVSPRVSVAHIATGREIVDCGTQPRAGQIRDSNSPMIAALIAAAGATPVFHRHVDESASELHCAIADALAQGVQILLISGGASVGDHDSTGATLEQAGFELHLQGVKSRPGKPLIIGQKGGVLAFGLPGNPLSHFVCFHLFVWRTIQRLAGATPANLRQVQVANAAEVKPNPRESWWPCTLDLTSPSATAFAHVLPWRDSSDLTALARVNALLRVPPEGLPGNGAAEALTTL